MSLKVYWEVLSADIEEERLLKSCTFIIICVLKCKRPLKEWKT